MKIQKYIHLQICCIESIRFYYLHTCVSGTEDSKSYCDTPIVFIHSSFSRAFPGSLAPNLMSVEPAFSSLRGSTLTVITSSKEPVLMHLSKLFHFQASCGLFPKLGLVVDRVVDLTCILSRELQ